MEHRKQLFLERLYTLYMEELYNFACNEFHYNKNKADEVIHLEIIKKIVDNYDHNIQENMSETSESKIKNYVRDDREAWTKVLIKAFNETIVKVLQI